MTRILPPAPSLELSGEAFRELVERVLDPLAHHLDQLEHLPANNLDGGRELADTLREGPPEQGTDLDDLIHLIFETALPCTLNAPGPGYMAYIPGGGLPHAGVADLIANTINRYVGLWQGAPGLVQLEANVVRWFCDIVGYPETGGGFLTSGGSLANLTGIVTARSELLGEDFLSGTLYVSDQLHHSIAKAARLAGLPTRNLRLVPSDDHFRLRLDALQEQIATDRAQGLHPFLVVGNAGATNTGTVDDLEALANLAESQGLWFHADAAYGGFFALTERGRAALRGMGRAHSITLDPHKSLFLPYGTGCLLARDVATLRRTHSDEASYLPPLEGDDRRMDFCSISPELSRDFRGLRVWLPLKLHGLETFRQTLDEKLDLARYLAQELRQIPHLEVLTEPTLSLVIFRLEPPHLDEDQLNDLNRHFLAAANRPRRVLLTPTTLPDGRFILRACILSFRTHQDRVQMALEDLQAAATEVLAETSP